jgi:hypothetical protein
LKDGVQNGIKRFVPAYYGHEKSLIKKGEMSFYDEAN